MTPRSLFVLGCLFELGLFLLGVCLAAFFGRPINLAFELTWTNILAGTAASAPMLCFFGWSLHSQMSLFIEVRDFLEEFVLPHFASLANWQLAVLAALAGLGEEVFFRGFLQALLRETVGEMAALASCSILFGLAHCVTAGYALIAGAIGLYIGLLFSWSHSLAVPIVCHAIYDLVALWYLLRWHRKR